MDASVAAVMGEAIGALGGLGGVWLTVLGQGRQQDRQRRVEHERWRNEIRRNAYNGCITSSKQLSASWWKMADLLWQEGSTPEQWQAGFVVVHEAWMQFSASVAAVTIAGPGSVADAADALREAMFELEKAGMEWHTAARGAGHDRLESFDARFQQTATAKRTPDKDFQSAAREALGTEAP